MKRLAAVLLFTLIAATAQASITVTFLGDDGKPLAGVRVRAFTRMEQRVMREKLLTATPAIDPIATATSGDDGKVTIDVKDNSVVRLVAEASNHAVLFLEALDGEDAGAFLLPTASARKGRVTAGGKPVGGALVAIAPWYLTKSDAQGNFEVPPLVHGVERAVVIHPDYAIGEASVTSVNPNDSARRPLEVVLVKGATITGRVVGAGDKPVAHAALTIGGWPRGTSRDDGTFTINHAPPNWRVLIASTATEAGAAMNGRKASVDVKLAPALTMHGVVKSKNGGVGGAYIALYSELDSTLQPSVISGAKGEFAIGGLLPGRYAIYGTHPAYAITRTTVDLPDASKEKAIAAEPLVRVQGHVIDEERKPVATAIVSLTQGIPGGSSLPPSAASGPDGSFVIRARPSAPIQMIVTHRSYAPSIVGPILAERVKDLSVTMQKGFALQVKVVDARKQAIPRAVVEISRAAEGGGPRSALPCATPREDCRMTKSDGTYEMRIVEGKYDVVVTSEDIAAKRLVNQQLSAKSSPLVVTVDRGVEVSGRVVMGDNAPVAGAFVQARAITSRNAVTAADGTFTLRGLPAGPISITATTPQGNLPMQSNPVSVTAPAKNVQLRIPAPATLSGRVIDKTSSQPVTDFQLTVAAPDIGSNMPMQFHSDDGSFTLDVVPGKFDLRATAPGYVHATLNGITAEEGRAVANLEMKMERGARVRGRVSAGGQPLAGANVYVLSTSPGGGSNAATDANGEYVVEGVEAGDHDIDVRKSGYLPKRKSVTATLASDARLDFDLERGGEMHGRVTDRGGRPIEGARVQARPGNNIGPATGGRVTSDSEGNFTIEGLAPGNYNVVAEHEGYVSATQSNVDVASSPTLILDRGGSITGRITGLPAGDLAGMSIAASYGSSFARGSVDSDGTFTIGGVPDGPAMVTATKMGPQMRHSTKRVLVTNGSTSPVEINFADGLSVRGRVTKDGQPVTRGNISFAPLKADNAAGGSAPIAPDGSYEVSGLVTAEYRVYINLYGGTGSTSYNERLAVDGSMTHDFDLQGSTLRGRVIDAATSAPLSGVQLTLDRTSGEIRDSRRATTDSDGRFAFDVLQEGKFNLVAQRAPYASKQQTIVVAANAPLPDVELRLEAAEASVVRVTDAVSGSPIGATVTLSDPQTKTMVATATARSDDGVAKVFAAAGSYSMSVWAAGYTPYRSDVTIPSAELRVTLQKGASIAFHLPDAQTYRTRLLLDGKQIRTDTLVPPFRTEINGLGPGAYTIEVSDVTGKISHGTYPVVLGAGQTVTVDVK